jgi:hypothetical protein
LIDLLLRQLYRTGGQTLELLCRRLALPVQVLSPLCDRMRLGGLIEPLHAGSGLKDRVWGLTGEGRRCAAEALARSCYVGPAPVPLEQYARQVEGESLALGPFAGIDPTRLSPDSLLREDQVDALGSAFTGRGIIFVHGPSGSGKTHVLKSLGRALTGTIRVPYAIAVGERVIEVFDPQYHCPCADRVGGQPAEDPRWVRCARPVITLGAEATASMFDLVGDVPGDRLIAPLQIKANLGLMLIDDFGVRRARAAELLARWLAASETGWDRLRLPDGGLIEVPVRGRWVLASVRSPEALGGEALVRRLGCRVELGPLSEPAYRTWLTQLDRVGPSPAIESLADWLIAAHRKAGLPLLPGTAARLIQIAIDGARYRSESVDLGPAALERAWRVHRGLPPVPGQSTLGSPEHVTIPTPCEPYDPGSIDVRDRQPHLPA